MSAPLSLEQGLAGVGDRALGAVEQVGNFVQLGVRTARCARSRSSR